MTKPEPTDAKALRRDDTGRITSDYEPTALEIEVARQAICREFGNNGTDGYYIRILKAIHAAALASQPAAPDHAGLGGRHIAAIKHSLRCLKDEIRRVPEKPDPVIGHNLAYFAGQIEEAIAALSRVQEPVAWLGEGDGFKSFTRKKSVSGKWRKGGLAVEAVYATPPAPREDAPAADGPVPTYECPLVIGQRVKLATPYAEDDPDRVFFITEIRWEYRQVAHRGWSITIAPSHDIEKGYGATDGYSPSDLIPASPAASQ